MAIRPLQITISLNRLISPFLPNPSFSFSRSCCNSNSNLAPSSHSFPHIIAFRHLAASAATPLSRPHKYHPSPQPHERRLRPPSQPDTLAHKIGKSTRRPGAPSKARVYADVNLIRPKEYWDYESLTVQWG